jgi:hypothetical protein
MQGYFMQYMGIFAKRTPAVVSVDIPTNESLDLSKKCRFSCFLLDWYITCHSKFFLYSGHFSLTWHC